MNLNYNFTKLHFGHPYNKKVLRFYFHERRKEMNLKRKRKATGNYAWGGTNGIYFVEIEGEGYIPIFPKDYGLPKWEALKAKMLFLEQIR